MEPHMPPAGRRRRACEINNAQERGHSCPLKCMMAYRLLSENGNPTLSSLNTIMNVLGIQLHFTPKEKAA